jgi:Fe-S cluster biogenesis protein NfuA
MITTENTPNPNALKFMVSREVRGNKAPLFYKKDPVNNPEADAPVAYALFKIDGVEDVFFGSDFITVGKSQAVEWDSIKDDITQTIEYHGSGPYVVEEMKPACDDINSDVGASKAEKQIVHLLDQRVRPAVAQDGGDIIFHSFKDGIVYLEMYGACSGCPSSTATLKMGIENMLRHYIPEVRRVEPV